MARETRVQSQVVSYQKLKKWYLIILCLTLSIIRYVSRVKWSNPGEGIAPSSTPRCSSYWIGSLRVALDYGRQLYLYYNITCLITTMFLRSDPLYSFVYKAYKSKVYFYHNAMMMIICSLVKIIAKHTHKYKKKIIWSNCRDFRYTSRLIYQGDKLKFVARSMYHHTHTLKIIYTTTHINMQI